MERKKIYTICTNCGKTGHMYKDCKFPISSFGIILFRKKDGVKQYLCIRRKDTIGYVELIRGNYSIQDTVYLEYIIDIMTIGEKNKILTMSFRELWHDLWCKYDEENSKFRNEFLNSQRKFNQIKDLLPQFIQKSKTNWIEPEWGFPKGRRNVSEADIDCAVREFEEEVGIYNNEYKLLKHIEPVIEEYKANNNVVYKHIYYISKYIGYTNREFFIDPNIKSQSNEIGLIKWFSCSELKHKIRDYHVQKYNIIEYLNNNVIY